MSCPDCDAWRDSQRVLSGLATHQCEPTVEQINAMLANLAERLNRKADQ